MSFFQDFLDQNSHISKELNKNVKSLDDLDYNFASENEKLIIMRKNFINSLHRHNSTSIPHNIEKEHEKCLNICENKMDLSNDAYYLLDNNIRKANHLIENLEQELISTKFSDFSYQNSLLDKNLDDLVNFESYLNNKKKSKSKKSRNALKNLNLNLNLSINSLKKRKSKKIVKLGKKSDKKSKALNKKKSENKKNLFNINNNFEDITHKEIDGKIGLREPIYCFCNYVSYGDMVKCDNPKCPREWFHFNCVGLSNFPKGKWYCSTKCATTNKDR